DGLRLAETGAAPAHALAPLPADRYAAAVVSSSAVGEPAPPAESFGGSSIVPIESLLYDETPVVPIESLLYDAPEAAEPDVVPIDSLAPAGGLEGSFRTYDRLRRDRG